MSDLRCKFLSDIINLTSHIVHQPSFLAVLLRALHDFVVVSPTTHDEMSKLYLNCSLGRGLFPSHSHRSRSGGPISRKKFWGESQVGRLQLRRKKLTQTRWGRGEARGCLESQRDGETSTPTGFKTRAQRWSLATNPGLASREMTTLKGLNTPLWNPVGADTRLRGHEELPQTWPPADE